MSKHRSTEEEIEERQFKRLKRWWNSLSERQRKMFTEDVNSSRTKEMMWERGWIDGKGELTSLGKLKLHQLNLLKYMAGITDEQCAKMAEDELQRQQAEQQEFKAHSSLFEE